MDKKHRQLPLTPPGRQHLGPHATQAMPTPTPAVPGLALQPSAQLSAAEVKRPVGSHAEAQLLQPRGLVSRADCLSLDLQASISTQPQDNSLLHVPQDPPGDSLGFLQQSGVTESQGVVFSQAVQVKSVPARDGAGAGPGPRASGMGCTHYALAQCHAKSSLKVRLRLRGRAAVGGQPALAAVRFCLDWAPRVF